jgi:hypothetical protein
MCVWLWMCVCNSGRELKVIFSGKFDYKEETGCRSLKLMFEINFNFWTNQPPNHVMKTASGHTQKYTHTRTHTHTHTQSHMWMCFQSFLDHRSESDCWIVRPKYIFWSGRRHTILKWICFQPNTKLLLIFHWTKPSLFWPDNKGQHSENLPESKAFWHYVLSCHVMPSQKTEEEGAMGNCNTNTTLWMNSGK